MSELIVSLNEMNIGANNQTRPQECAKLLTPNDMVSYEVMKERLRSLGYPTSKSFMKLVAKSLSNFRCMRCPWVFGQYSGFIDHLRKKKHFYGQKKLFRHREEFVMIAREQLQCEDDYGDILARHEDLPEELKLTLSNLLYIELWLVVVK